MSKRVLVTGGRLPAALEICRGLAMTGARVISVDTFPVHICQGSRLVRRSYRVTSPKEDFAGFKQDVLDIVKRERIDLVVPSSEDVFYLARFADVLRQHCDLFFPDPELPFNVHHKQTFIEMAAKIGLAVPKSQLYISGSVIPGYCAKDYILKQVFSRAGQGVIFAKAGIHPSAYGAKADGSWLVQEKLEGETLCSCSIVHKGTIAAHLVYRPSVTLGSVGVVFRQIDQKAIRTWVETFVAATGYHGIVSMDFIVSPSGEAAAIECNPRPTSGVHLFEPEMLGYGIRNPESLHLAVSRRQRAQVMLGMLSALPTVLRKKRNLKEKLLDIVRARDVIVAWRDPGPALYQLVCYGYLLYRCWKSKLPFSACMIDGVDWNGREVF